MHTKPGHWQNDVKTKWNNNAITDIENEKADVKQKEAQVIEALLISGGIAQAGSENGKSSPPVLSATMRAKLYSGACNRGDVLKIFVEQIGTVEYEDVAQSAKQVEEFVKELVALKLIASVKYKSPPCIPGSIVSKTFQGALGKELAINTYNMTKEYSKNLVSVWDLDELIFLKADAFDSIGTPD